MLGIAYIGAGREMKLRIAALLLYATGSATHAFASCPTRAPLLVAPANGAANISSPVAFKWTDVDGAELYRLMASFNGGTANPIAITRDNDYAANVPAGPVEWWVDALAANCQTLGSPHFRFTAVGGTAGCPSNPQSPTLIAPMGGATVNSPVTFIWSAVAGVSAYRVWAATAGAAVPVLLGSSNSTNFTAQLPQGVVTWYVEARFGDCPSSFSTRSAFTVASPTVCSNMPTTLLSPANNATNVTTPVTFTWSPVGGAIGYKLYLSINGAAADLVGVTSDTTLTRLAPQGLITWWVDTAFAGCPDQHSAEFRFSTAATNCPTGSIALTSPANGTTVASPVNFAWTGINGATAYRIWFSIDGAAPQLSGRVTSTSATLPAPSGNAVWQIEALFDNCPSFFSPRGNFTISRAANCSQNSAPALVSPANGAQAQGPIDFTWTSVPGTLAYRVWASVNGEPFGDVGITNDTHLKRDMPAGLIAWYVEAIFGGCPALASARSTFRIATAACPTEVPLLISPADNATNVTAPVTLVWSAVTNAKEYRLFASLNGTDFALLARTSDTSATRAFPPATFTWFVEAAFEGCPSVRSTRFRFTVAHAAQCSGELPVLVLPASNATNVTSPVRLDWDPVSGAFGYHVFARYAGGATTLIGESRGTEITRDLPEGTTEWWVQAFVPGCPPTNSTHSSFTVPQTSCNNRRPILMFPNDGASGLISPIQLRWSPLRNAKSYKVWAAIDDEEPGLLGTTTANTLSATLPTGTIFWYVEATFDSCPTAVSAVGSFSVRSSSPGCAPPERPVASATAQVASGTPFTIQWTAVPNATSFELQEATSLDFSGATTEVIPGVSTTITKTVSDLPTRYFYRVRAISSCSDDRGPYSRVVSAIILPEKANAQRQTTIDVGAQSLTQQLVIPGQNPPVTFSARADKPWITVTPASGTLGPEGTTLTVTYDPSALKLGTNTGTVLLTFGGAGSLVPNGVQPVLPVSVSLVTPVAPGGKNTPTPDSLIIPAVGHAAGANDSLFESDVRVANTSAQTQKYQLNFTLSGTDGTQSGQSTTIQIDPGATMALDDILTNFFGIGSDGTSATGMLEIRPLTTATNLPTSGVPSIQTVASSRTFNTTPTGTFGQFIPAIPFAQFVGQSSVISLQQVAQSTAFRTNLGLVEAAGESASVLVHVFDNSGHELTQVPVTLLPSEHVQMNSFLQTHGISLSDGRLEVEVTSATGKVTAYASVVDNLTNDPLLVFPVLKGGGAATRFVLPGVGDFDVGVAHWKSDVRIFNSATTPVSATLTYSYHDAAGAPQQATASLTLNGGEVRAIDNLIASTWPALTQTTGSLLVTSPSASSLVATARTYTQTSSGTYGQFIPAVTPAQAVGSGERSLQLLQLESSDRYRTNIGLAETSGSSATAHVSLILPDSKFAISTDIPLAANEFKQFSLASFNAGTVYNGRVTVTVTGGSGRVTAYGSVIDQLTQDPTYVPAQ